MGLEQVMFRICTPVPQSVLQPDHVKVRQGQASLSEVTVQDSTATGLRAAQSALPPEDGQMTERDLVPDSPQDVAVQLLH